MIEEKIEKLIRHQKIMKSNKVYITLLKKRTEKSKCAHEVRKHEDWSSLNPS